jgi:hypothetical protein
MKAVVKVVVKVVGKAVGKVVRKGILYNAIYFKPSSFLVTSYVLALTVGVAMVADLNADLYNQDFHQRGEEYCLYYLSFDESFLVLQCMEDVLSRTQLRDFATGEFMRPTFLHVIFLLAERYFNTKTTVLYRIEHWDFFTWITYSYVAEFMRKYLQFAAAYTGHGDLSDRLRFCLWGFPESYTTMNFREVNPLFTLNCNQAIDQIRHDLLAARGSCGILRYLNVTNLTPRPRFMPHFDLSFIRLISVGDFRLAAYLVERKDLHDSGIIGLHLQEYNSISLSRFRIVSFEPVTASEFLRVGNLVLDPREVPNLFFHGLPRKYWFGGPYPIEIYNFLDGIYSDSTIPRTVAPHIDFDSFPPIESTLRTTAAPSPVPSPTPVQPQEGSSLTAAVFLGLLVGGFLVAQYCFGFLH